MSCVIRVQTLNVLNMMQHKWLKTYNSSLYSHSVDGTFNVAVKT